MNPAKIKVSMSIIAGVAGTILGGLTLTGCDSSESASLPTTSTVTNVVPAAPERVVETVTKTNPPPVPLVLGPRGYAHLTLGMTKKAALATGKLGEVTGSDGTCTRYQLKGGGQVVISDNLGVAQIGGPASVATPRGIRPGSTISEAKAAYPGTREYRSGLMADVPGNASASYDFMSSAPGDPYLDSNRIDQVRMALNKYDCALAL